jgi:hypothetical protein
LREEIFVTEADMPPPERPKPRHQEGEQEHLREDAGLADGPGEGAEPAEHLREDAGQQASRREQVKDKGLLEKVKDRLMGR